MTRNRTYALGVAAIALISCGLSVQAQTAEQQPLALFETPEHLPPGIQDLHQRAITSYPDMTRSRIIRINFDIIEHIFGPRPESDGDYLGPTPPGQIDVDDGVGVGTPLLINFFEDQTIEVTVDRTAAGTSINGTTYHYLSLQPTDKPSEQRFLAISFNKNLVGNKYVSLHYGSAYAKSYFYSLRRLPGTPYHVLIERNRGPDYYYGSVLQPDLSLRDSLSMQLIGGGAGLTAVVGPIIDYGLADFSFGDNQVGYAISKSATSGHPPRAFKTIDGGQTWHTLEVDADWVPTRIYFRNRNEGYLSLRFNPVGHSIQNIRGCGLLRTEDGGAHWERLRGPLGDYCLTAIRFHSDGTGYGYGFDRQRRSGFLWRSSDNGRSWSRWVEVSNIQLVRRLEIFDDEIIPIPYLGVEPVIEGLAVFGRDGGLRDSIYIEYPRVRQIRLASRDIIFANVSDELGNYLLRTLDGGRTWRRVLEGQFGLAYVGSADEVGIVLSKGRTSRSDTSGPVSVFAYTADGGLTWAEGPTTDLSPYLRDNLQKLEDGTELTLLGNNLLRVTRDNP